jgi:hypothetical protein
MDIINLASINNSTSHGGKGMLYLITTIFTVMENTMHKKTGLAVGAHSSSIMSEIYLQCQENSCIVHILIKYETVVYFRYVDDIVIVYSLTRTNDLEILDEFSKVSPNPDFTMGQ